MIEAGKTYVAQNQGRAITPHSFKVRVVWVEADRVHYRLPNDTYIYITTLERFREIVGDV